MDGDTDAHLLHSHIHHKNVSEHDAAIRTTVIKLHYDIAHIYIFSEKIQDLTAKKSCSLQ